MKPMVKKGNEAGPQATRRPGRPRSEQASRAILEATVHFLEQRGNGLADLTIEHIAAAAGVGKATVYRWWSTKTELVTDAFTVASEIKLKFIDSGSVVADMSDQMQKLARLMAGPRGRMLSAILAAGQSDDKLLRAFRERFILARRREGRATLERAIARGELPQEVDQEAILDALYGPLYFRFLIWRKLPTDRYIQELCQRVMRPQCETEATRRRESTESSVPPGNSER